MEAKQVRRNRAVSLLVGMIMALGVLSPRAFAQTNPVPGANQAAVAPGSPPATGAEDSAATRGPQQAAPNAATRARVIQTYGKLPLAFEANLGQTDPQVKFLARGSGYTLFLTGDGAVLALRQAEGGKRKAQSGNDVRNSKIDVRHWSLVTHHSPAAAQSVVRMKLVGANSKAAVTGLAELPGKSNYFIGNDPKKWRTDVPDYAQVRYRGVYPGIDLVYYGNQGRLEYDFVVAPGADPRAITLDIGAGLAPPSRQTVQRLHGRAQQAAPLRVAPNGDLVMRLVGGEIRFYKPVVYQLAVAPVSSPATGAEDSAATEVAAGFSPAIENQNPCPAKAGLYGPAQPRVAQKGTLWLSDAEVASAANPKSAIENRKYLDGRYVLEANNQVEFAVASYDRSQPLIIDPVLTYSSLLGGSRWDIGYGIAVDDSGSAYVTGYTQSTDFPRVNQIPGACNGTCGGGNSGSDAFLTKINAAGNALAYSSYIGGSSQDEGHSIAVDSSGNTFLTGETDSPDFPRVNQIPGACKGSCGNGSVTNAFVTKINAAGNALVYSSLIGGSGGENDLGGGSIALDGSVNVYLTGYTSSADFPRVNQIPGACNGSCGNGSAVNTFVTKINAAGSALVYSSLIGGSYTDEGYGVAVDSSGSAYLTGASDSADFPRVNQIPGACNGSCGSGYPFFVPFVAKINTTGSTLIYS
ncbi:MAG: SBBP repeat-containing protein, partial [Terriglobia bacterium]